MEVRKQFVGNLSPVRNIIWRYTLKQLITIFTDPGDVVIDPCAGSGTTLRAARELGRHSYGFECSREFYEKATTQMLGHQPG